MVIFVVILVGLGSIVACHLIAHGRGGNGVYWGVMGFLFGPFAIPFAFFAKPQRPDSEPTPD